MEHPLKVNLALVSLKPQSNFCVVLIALYPNSCMLFRSSSLMLEKKNSCLRVSYCPVNGWGNACSNSFRNSNNSEYWK